MAATLWNSVHINTLLSE